MSELYFFKNRNFKTRFPLIGRFVFLMLLLGQGQYSWAQWTRQQKANHTRAEMVNVLYQDKMYSFGGIGTWPIVEPIPEVYDPARNKWKSLASMPAGKTVTHQGIVVVDNKIWHIGGRLDNTLGPLTSEVWIYDVNRNSWAKGPELKDPATGKPIPWGGGGAALIGRTIHLVGGFIYTSCKSDQDQYHFTLNVDKWLANPRQTTWENKLTPMPIKRNHFSTIVFNGKMYVLGGQFGHDCGGGQDQKYSHVYNPLTDKWTRLTDLPMVRSHCEASTFVADGKIYMVGGDGGPNKVTRFNPETNSGRGSWTELPALTLPRALTATSAKVIGNKLILAGGRPYNKHLPLLDTYSAPFPRRTTYKLDFLENCFSRTVAADEPVKIKNLLFTMEGEKNYRLTSNAAWLKITSRTTGRALPTGTYVEATIQATGLAAGSYQATITAEGVKEGRTFTKASFCVNLKVTKGSSVLTIKQTGNGSVTKSPDKATYKNGEKVKLTAKAASGYTFANWSGDASGTKNPVYITIKGNQKITANFRRKAPELATVRINAGGATQTVNNITWRGCPTGKNCKNYVEGGYARKVNPGNTIMGADYNSLNQAMYQTEWTSTRTGPGRNNYFIYRVPVKNGKYLVQLFFVESDKNGSNQREFDVRIEGDVVLPNFDIYAAASGKNRAIVRSFPVTVTDGSVRIDFINRIDKAKVNAIAIVPYKNAELNKEPVAKAGNSRTVTANASGYAPVTLNGSESYDKDGYLVLHQWYLNDKFLGNGVTYPVNLKVGTHQVKLLVKDNARAIHTVTTTIRVKAAAQSIKPDTITTIVYQELRTAEPTTHDSTARQLPGQETGLAVHVYPNPGTFGDKTTLELSHAAPQEEITVSLYDITGKLIQTDILKPDDYGVARLDYLLTDKFSAGTYLIRAVSKSGATQTRLLVR
ncbi:T9SS type A sorting domain-containing protein [Adhaeribacter swui]|uniref:T9SS type A sorting domain-containing protein n=1 Tax=Adhaeribacter swui TaxID=2086471 RepID=A0A7G7GEJ9_9BACT|nr:malectin domain-containing carbohydrate-binding protein [Adhaeribacter swui]QNF35583.1 T9SS type A sorting domain-containing protein [Adhaeribacter swui]